MINVDSTIHDGDFVSAAGAARPLGVRRETLYAYASRGLLTRVAHAPVTSDGDEGARPEMWASAVRPKKYDRGLTIGPCASVSGDRVDRWAGATEHVRCEVHDPRPTVTSQRSPPSQRQVQSLRPSSRHPGPGPRAVAPKECRIALFQMNDGDYQRLLREECLRAARRYDFPVRTFSADNDSERQIDQIHSCLKEAEATRPTVILVCPVHDASLVSAAYAAARLGVGWVLLGRWSVYMATLREAFPRLPVFSVAADQKEIGRIQGQLFRSLLPDGGDLFYIRGPLGISSAARRFEGVQETLHGSSIKISAISSDWTFDGGQRAMKEWLHILGKGELSRFVLGAQNDAMAMGARTALATPSAARPNPLRGRIPVVGCDGTPDYGQRLVTDGKLAATVIMPPTTGKAVHEIASMFGGNARPDAEILLAPSSFPALTSAGQLAVRPRAPAE